MELDVLDVVEDTEQMSLDGVGVTGLTEDLQQCRVRDEEETGEQQTLLLQVPENEDCQGLSDTQQSYKMVVESSQSSKSPPVELLYIIKAGYLALPAYIQMSCHHLAPGHQHIPSCPDQFMDTIGLFFNKT